MQLISEVNLKRKKLNMLKMTISTISLLMLKENLNSLLDKLE